MAKSRTATLESFRSVLSKPIELEVLLAKAGQKDRTNVEKHLAALDEDHAAIWRRLTRALGTLAPLAITTVGQQAVQFFIADGKYRMQVFALEDLHDGQIVVYLPDVLAEALKLKIITPEAGPEDQPDRYTLVASKGHSLHIEQMNGSNTSNPAPHFKNMLGWNRKALRIPIPITAASAHIEAIEDLAAIASRAWAEKKAG
jgi:hypothetical protein